VVSNHVSVYLPYLQRITNYPKRALTFLPLDLGGGDK